MNSMKGSITLGYGLMLLAFLCFACMDTSAKWLVTALIPAIQVAWLRYLGHLLWVLLLYGPRQGRVLLQSRQPWQQALRAVFLLLGTVLNFTALQYLPLTTTIAIFFVAPLMVCLISIPVLGERVGIQRLTAVLIGFAGVLVIVQPWSARFDPAVFLALGAMLSISGYFVMSRLIAGVDSNATTQLYTAGIATLVIAPAALPGWVWPASFQAWCVIAVIGSLGMLGHSLLTRAHQYAEASVLAPTVYSQAVYIAILSWLVFDQMPDRTTFLGTLIIVGSGLFIWFRERRAKAVA